MTDSFVSHQKDVTVDKKPKSGVKPRIWPLFVACLVTLLATVVIQGVVAVIILFVTRGEGESVQAAAQKLTTTLMRPPIFVLMLICSGSTIMVPGLLFGWLSAKRAETSLSKRLGLTWPALSPVTWVGFLLGSVPVLLLSVAVVVLIEMVISGDKSTLVLYENMTTPWAILFIILIGVLPGFGEELFFRGYMQRRLLQRWNPVLAIGVTSIIFGLFHVTPHGIALATIIGVWLGIIAWRTDSIWPTVCCHAFINSGWNVYQVGRIHWGIPTIPPLWFNVIGGTVVMIAFAWSAIYLYKSASELEVHDDEERVAEANSAGDIQ